MSKTYAADDFSAIRDRVEEIQNEKFELNSLDTCQMVRESISRYFSGLDSRGFIYRPVVCDETNNTPETIANNELNVDIWLTSEEYQRYLDELARISSDYSTDDEA